MITCAVEPILRVAKEAGDLIKDHAAEHDIWGEYTLDVDLSRYAMMEAHKALICVAIRDGGSLLGYCVAIIFDDAHHKDTDGSPLRFLMSHVFHIEKRRYGFGLRALKIFMEGEAVRRGLDAVAWRVRGARAADFFCAMGYAEAERVLVKPIRTERGGAGVAEQS